MSNEGSATSAQKRIVSVLFTAQSFFSASSIAAFTLSPIISATLIGSDSWVGLPNAVVLLGRAGFALPFGLMMDRFGRRLALSGGYSMAIIGSAISAWAIAAGSFFGFLVGALFLGMARSAGDQSRYVGAEVFTLSKRAKVIGIIVSAGTIGAILGPLLVPASTAWMAGLGLPEQAGPFIISGILMIFATGAVFFFLRPDPKQLGQEIAEKEAAENQESGDHVAGERRSLRQIFAAPMVQLAVISMVLAFFVMAFLMVITPLHMDRGNHSTSAIFNRHYGSHSGYVRFVVADWRFDRSFRPNPYDTCRDSNIGRILYPDPAISPGSNPGSGAFPSGIGLEFLLCIGLVPAF